MKIVVLGGGASGVFYALVVKKNHPEFEVTVFESSDRLLKRILVSGNGRSNFFNGTLLTSTFAGAYDHPHQAKSFIDRETAKETLDFLQSLGLVYVCDDSDRYYPFSNSSATLHLLLSSALRENDVKVVTDARAVSVQSEDRSVLFENESEVFFDRLFLACGGDSYDRIMQGNSRLLDSLNVPFTPFVPALCPLKTKEKIPTYLVGTRFFAHLKLFFENRMIYDEEGEILIKKDGLSGIAIMNASLFYNSQVAGKYEIGLDLTHRGHATVPKHLYRYPEKFLNEKLCTYIKQVYKNNYDTALTDLRLEISDRYGFEDSQVSKGGILLEAIDPQTMTLKKDKRIAVGGEVIDLTGICGGYNLGLAFISGYKAGNSLDG